MLGGLAPPKSCSSWGASFSSAPGPRMLVRSSSLFTKSSEYKIDHTSKTTNRKYLKIGSALVSDYFTSSGMTFF